MDILIPKYNYSSLDAAQGMRDELRDNIQDIVESHQHLDGYYLLVVVQPDMIHKQLIRQTIMIIPEHVGEKLTPYLSTMCFRVDNRKGSFETVWVLPRDYPIPEKFCSDLELDGPSASRYARKFGSPLVYSRT